MLNRNLRRHRVAVGYTILCLGMAFAILLAGVAINRVNDRSNATRCAVVALVQNLLANSQRNAQAALASPTASHEQKDAASKNLAAIRDVLKTTEDSLGHPHGASCPEIKL